MFEYTRKMSASNQQSLYASTVGPRAAALTHEVTAKPAARALPNRKSALGGRDRRNRVSLIGSKREVQQIFTITALPYSRR
jgi:hypothetical protein